MTARVAPLRSWPVALALGLASCASTDRGVVPAPPNRVGDEPDPVRTPMERARERARRDGLEGVVPLLSELVSFQTVAAVAGPAEGEAFSDMEAALGDFARSHGLELRVFGDREVWEIVLPGRDRGASPALRLVAHGDVAPVNAPPSALGAHEIPSGWTVPPFVATVRDGHLWGRGTQDDKGALAAALVAMAILHSEGFEPDADVVLAVGTAEEHDWDGMIRYAEEAPRAGSVVSIDADFPVVTAESGFVRYGYELPFGPERCRGARPRVISLAAGAFLTQTPEQAAAVLEACGGSAADLARRAEEVAARELDGRRPADGAAPFVAVVEQRGPAEPGGASAVRLVVRGRSVHSSIAPEGHNPLWPLAAILRSLDVADGGARALAELIAEGFDGDHHGVRIGLRYEDDFMGPLVVAPTLLSVEGDRVVLQVNMRRPRGLTSEGFSARLAASTERLRRRFPGLEARADPYVGEPHVVDREAPVVVALLETYRRGLPGSAPAPIAMRGGSYARLFEHGVSFGPLAPGDRDLRHAADERISLETLDLNLRLLIEAIVRLSTTTATTGGAA